MARSSRLSVCLAIVMRIPRRSIAPDRSAASAPRHAPPGSGHSRSCRRWPAAECRELGRLSCRLAIQETVRTAGVEAQHPVPDDLKSDTADLGRLGARCPIVDSRECQKPASLRPVFGLPCQTANLWRIKILAQWCRSRHDEPPGFAMLNLTRLHLGIAHESQFQGLGISSHLSVRWAE